MVLGEQRRKINRNVIIFIFFHKKYVFINILTREEENLKQ